MKELNLEYQNALDFIYSHINLGITRNLRYSPEKFDLNRMRNFASLLGNPQDQYPVIHVAGTKGKGSTCAMLANIMSLSGYRTGFYSSPHIIDFRERIRIGDLLISKREIVDGVGEMIPAEEIIKEISTFELITAMAYTYFSKRKVDLAVLEVGLGGRLDATNIVNPILSIITSISKDHTQILGNTIEKIAGEKAGIIKKAIPVISSYQSLVAKKVISEIAQQNQSDLTFSDEVYRTCIIERKITKQTFKITENHVANFKKFSIPLIGDHQVENATTVIAAVEKLREIGWEIPDKAIEVGFQTVDWPGRMEIVRKEPLILVDGAHNLDSFRKLKNVIEQYLPGKKIILLFGASEDKDILGMIKIIKPVINRFIFSKTEHPRAAEINKIIKIGEKLNLEYESYDLLEDALQSAINVSNSDNVIIAAGSLFIAGGVKNILNPIL